MLFYPLLHNVVAPYVGAWIETRTDLATNGHDGSHPMWVRGLKQLEVLATKGIAGRTLCGCVD